VTHRQVIDVLRELPGQVEELVQGLNELALTCQPGPNGWSIKEVCAHLRDAIETDGSRIQHMLTENNPQLPAYDQEERARSRNYQQEDTARVLLALRAFAGGVAYLLEGMADADWTRTGQHEEAGRQTIEQRAELMAAHAREHLAQIKTLRAALPAHGG